MGCILDCVRRFWRYSCLVVSCFFVLSDCICYLASLVSWYAFFWTSLFFVFAAGPVLCASSWYNYGTGSRRHHHLARYRGHDFRWFSCVFAFCTRQFCGCFSFRSFSFAVIGRWVYLFRFRGFGAYLFSFHCFVLPFCCCFCFDRVCFVLFPAQWEGGSVFTVLVVPDGIVWVVGLSWRLALSLCCFMFPQFYVLFCIYVFAYLDCF